MATGEITEFHELQFSNNVELLLDQRGSLLRESVINRELMGRQSQAIKQIGTKEAQQLTTRFADTPNMQNLHTSRWVFPDWFVYTDFFDQFIDGVQMMIDPMSMYAKDAADALGRKMDDKIIAAFFADSKTGDLGTITTPFDAANQTVDQNVGGTTTGMNLKKLREAKRILMHNQVDIKNDTLYVAMTAQQHDDLLGETQAVSLDYNNKPVLVDGMITAFMGFKFIVSERLVVDGSLYRRCPCWAESGMALGIWKGIETEVVKRPDKMNIPQLIAKASFDATRLQEKKVVEIKCAE